MTFEWATGLPDHIRLTPYQIERLEIIRLAVAASDIEFHLHIRTHPESTKMLQRQQYQRAKKSQPGMPEEFYLLTVLLERLEAARLTGGDLFDFQVVFPDTVSIEDPQLVSTALGLIRAGAWRTIEELADGIVAYEAQLPENVVPNLATADARHQIALILRESQART